MTTSTTQAPSWNFVTAKTQVTTAVRAAPKPFTVTAAQVGQVFAVVLDNSTPPNIYIAASSAYGLPIVALLL